MLKGVLKVMKAVFKSFAVASVLAFSVGSAQAVTVNYQNHQGNDAFNGNASAGVKVQNPLTAAVSAQAGGFSLNGNIFGTGNENFVAWCLDIAQKLAKTAEYTVTKIPFSAGTLTSAQTTDIGKLFNTAYKGLNLKNGAESAGFQLALWEIIYEKPGAGFDLKQGALIVKSDSKSGAIAKGQAFLKNLEGKVTQRWNLTFLDSKKNQDLVTATPVPVPAAAWLMLLALGGLAAAGRRRTV